MTPTQIKQLRQRLGLTQMKFAALVGVTLTSVTRWETGATTPSPLAQRALDELARQVKTPPSR